MTEVKVHFNGWIELPEEACAALSLRTGAMLDIALVDGRIVITRAGKAEPAVAPTVTDMASPKPEPAVAPAVAGPLAAEPEQPRRRGRPPGVKAPELPRIGPVGLKVRGRTARVRTLETVD